MISEGCVVLFRFPQTDQQEGKLRPALVLRQLPGKYNDWLICMISSQVNQEIPGFDDFVSPGDSDFIESGLKLPSIVRVGRLAVVDESIFLGILGRIDNRRLHAIREKIAGWIREK